MEFQFFLASLGFHLKKWPQAVCLAFLCFLLVRWYIKHKNQVISYWPLLRTLPSLLSNAKRLNEWSTEVFNWLGSGSCYIYGPIFSKLTYMATCNPNNLEYILKTNSSNYPKGPDYMEIFDILGDGVFNADSDSWRAQRKMWHSWFRSVGVRCLVENTCRKVVEDKLIPFLAHVAKQGTSIDLQDVFSSFTFSTSMSSLFGRDDGYLSLGFPAKELAKALTDIHEPILYRYVMPFFVWKLQRWLKIGKERKLAEARKTINLHLAEYISLKREDLLKGVETADLLLKHMNSHGERSITLAKNIDKFLRDTAVNFLLAGRDTIASGLVFFFWLVSKTPRVEAKILEELKLVYSTKKKETEGEFGPGMKRPWVFDSDDLRELVYLHAAFCESLRLYPPLPLNSKHVLKEDVLPDGTTVRPGMQIIISIYAAGRMPWIWGEDCLEFKPERWIDDNGKLRHELMSKFFVFNVGTRTCIGKDIAFTQMKSTAATVLFNFHVEVVEGHPVSIKPFLTLHMRNGLMVKIKERAMW